MASSSASGPSSPPPPAPVSNNLTQQTTNSDDVYDPSRPFVSPFAANGGPPPPPTLPIGIPPPTLAAANSRPPFMPPFPPPSIPRQTLPAPSPPAAVLPPSNSVLSLLQQIPAATPHPEAARHAAFLALNKPKPKDPVSSRPKTYQDEKYVLREPVWKVVAGSMLRVHFSPPLNADLPIEKIIATKKTDAIALHRKLLVKSPNAAIYYSDGSFKNGWAWGAAVEWDKTANAGEGGVGKKLREELGQCDPTDAEMGGMRKALEAFASTGVLKETELYVFCDSQAAITLM